MLHDAFSMSKRAALSGTLLLASMTLAQAQGKPFEIVVPTAAGGKVDIFARQLAVPLSRELKRTAFNTNKAGATGLAAVEYVSTRGDGNTILITTSDHSIQSRSSRLQPISKLAYSPAIIVTLASRGDLSKLIAGTPKTIAVPSSQNILPTAQIIAEIARSKSGNLPSIVPFSNAGEIITSVLGGHTDIGIIYYKDVSRSILDSGHLNYVLVTNNRIDGINAPTLKEQGFQELFAHAWISAFASTEVGDIELHNLRSALVKAINDPDFLKQMTSLGYFAADQTDAIWMRSLNQAGTGTTCGRSGAPCPCASVACDSNNCCKAGMPPAP